jgi:radical SAM protein with 4Fe4S-binding SPASM domain
VYRLWNLLLLKWSFHWSRFRKKSTIIGMPFALSIEPTTACNLACPACPSGLKSFTRPTGKLNINEHATWLKELKKSVFYINYYFQGEPFLHRQFLQLIHAAKKEKIYTATSTNAHFIDLQKAQEIVASGLDRLIISIDGLTQETYESYRINGQLSKVMEGSKAMVKAKKMAKSHTPYLIFQFLVVRANEHQIEQVQAIATDIGIDEVRFKTAQVYDYKHGNELIPTNEKYARYIKKPDGTYRLKYKGMNHCWRMWSSSVITFDGKVVPCCFDKDAQHQFGTLAEAPFQSIWKNKQYHTFRQSVLSNRNQIEICNNCSEGAKVWVD